MNNQLFWWEEFEKNNTDENINEIIIAINDAEQKLNKDSVESIQSYINSLDKTRYQSEISVLRKRYNILENRIDRQISDDFGTFLRTLRKERKLSLAQLGEMTGISPSYINRLELRQRKSPSINIMENLANALDVPLSLLTQAAGINLNDGKAVYLNDLISQNNISLSRYGNKLTDSEKSRLLDLVGFIISDDLDLKDEYQKDTLIQLTKDFRSELDLTKKHLS